MPSIIFSGSLQPFWQAVLLSRVPRLSQHTRKSLKRGLVKNGSFRKIFCEGCGCDRLFYRSSRYEDFMYEHDPTGTVPKCSPIATEGYKVRQYRPWQFSGCSAPLMLLHMTSYCIIRITSAEILPRRIKSWSSSSGLDAQRSMRATGPPRRTLEKLPFRMIRVPGVPGVHVVLIRTFNKGRRIRRRVSLASYLVGTATLRFGLGHIFLFRRVVCARRDQSRYPQRLLGRC